MKRVFLGGTCNPPDWRKEIIELLEKVGFSYFNPLLDNTEDWNDEAQEQERKERELCDFCLYTITPNMTGVYSVAEAVDVSNKHPTKTIFCALKEYCNDSFSDDQWKSIEQVGKLINMNGGFFCTNLEAAVLNMYQSNDIAIECIVPFQNFKHLIHR